MRKILSILVFLTLLLSLVTANGLAAWTACGNRCCCKPVAKVYAHGTERIESILSVRCCGNTQMYTCGSVATATYRRIEYVLSGGHTEQTFTSGSAAVYIEKITESPPSVGEKYIQRNLKVHSSPSSLFDQNCLLLI